ncbi:hypothetical protein Tco_0218912 [Tanacetum coccineum]
MNLLICWGVKSEEGDLVSFKISDKSSIFTFVEMFISLDSQFALKVQNETEVEITTGSIIVMRTYTIELGCGSFFILAKDDGQLMLVRLFMHSTVSHNGTTLVSLLPGHTLVVCKKFDVPCVRVCSRFYALGNLLAMEGGFLGALGHLEQ